MGCNGLHHACQCKDDLLLDLVESLGEILAGLNNYRESLPMYDRIPLGKSITGVNRAVVVLNKAKRLI